MKRKGSFSVLTFLSAILVVLLLAGCGSNSSKGNNTGNSSNTNSEAEKETKIDPVENGTTFSSTDGIIEITAPKDWDNIDSLNETANLQLGNLSKEQYTIAISEDSSDFSDSFTLQDYYDVIVPSMEQSLTETKISDTSKVTINGNEAIQFDISGEIDKIKITYLITVVKSEKYYHQLISWTLQSKYPEYKDLFKSVASSLTEK